MRGGLEAGIHQARLLKQCLKGQAVLCRTAGQPCRTRGEPHGV